jgi:predicted DNA-binding transcriptional regulator YafY
MSESARLYRYMNVLRDGRPVSKERLMGPEEVSLATFKRDIQKLRDQFGVPIEFDREAGGYIIKGEVDFSELPGMWFSPDEIIGLATIQNLLQQLAPSLMSGQLKTVQNRLNQLLTKSGIDPAELASRVLLMPLASRQPDDRIFSSVVKATLERKRVLLVHHNRERNETSQREVSPIDVEHYRDNWYLSGWCHTRNDIRRFAIDAILKAETTDKTAKSVDDKLRKARLQGSYGIFSGVELQWATIRFTAERAKWVANESWHPQQKTTTDSKGRLTLEVPYSDHRELVADILRHGPAAEVLKPKSLRSVVSKALTETLEQYQQ